MDGYIRGKLLGQGSYGSAYEAVDKASGEARVVKVLALRGLTDKETETAVREAQLMLALAHPYVVRCYEAFQEDEHLYIVLEHCAEGDLSAVLGLQQSAISEVQLALWFSQLLLGLTHIHDQRIVHRDLKPQNIFRCADNTLKIGDFGVSRILSSTSAFARTLLGTPYYLSPEICSKKSYKQKTDIWSLGCVFFELASLKKPFQANSQRLLYSKIQSGSYPPLPQQYSKEMYSLIAGMLQVDPSRRPSAHQLLQMPFFEKWNATRLKIASREKPRASSTNSPVATDQYLRPNGDCGSRAFDPISAQTLVKQDALAVGERALQRMRAARRGHQQIDNLRLLEQQKALEEEHLRAQGLQRVAMEQRQRIREIEVAKNLAKQLQAEKAKVVGAKQRATRAKGESVARDRQLRREQARALIREQKAAWALKAKDESEPRRGDAPARSAAAVLAPAGFSSGRQTVGSALRNQPGWQQLPGIPSGRPNSERATLAFRVHEERERIWPIWWKPRAKLPQHL